MKIIGMVSILLLAGCSQTSNQPVSYADQMRRQQFYANLAAGNAALSGARYPTMVTPQVTPITPPGGNQVMCIRRGIYTNCRY